MFKRIYDCKVMNKVTNDFWFVNKSILVAIKAELPDSNTFIGVEDGQIDFYI